MRLFLSILILIVLSFIAEHFFAWWSIAIVSFFVGLLSNLSPGKAFLSGFLGIGIFWLIMILCKDIPNNHILSQRMATLVIKTPDYILFILMTVIIGGLVGGFAAWSGGLGRRMFN